MRKPRPKKPDPAANMFAIAVDADGNERGIARCDNFESLRCRVIDNMKLGLFTEITILNIRQLGPVMKRIIG